MVYTSRLRRMRYLDGHHEILTFIPPPPPPSTETNTRKLCLRYHSAPYVCTWLACYPRCSQCSRRTPAPCCADRRRSCCRPRRRGRRRAGRTSPRVGGPPPRTLRSIACRCLLESVAPAESRSERWSYGGEGSEGRRGRMAKNGRYIRGTAGSSRPPALGGWKAGRECITIHPTFPDTYPEIVLRRKRWRK